jgi:hypothetical protein
LLGGGASSKPPDSYNAELALVDELGAAHWLKLAIFYFFWERPRKAAKNIVSFVQEW